MDSYQLRSRTQGRAPSTDRQTDTLGRDQTVANTVSQSDRWIDEHTDISTTDQTVDKTARPVPTPLVVPTQSGDTLRAHAIMFPSESGDQRVSVDSTVDLVLDLPPDSELQTVRQDYSSRGQRKDRPAFPGLTLSVAEASYYGTGSTPSS